MGKSRSTKDAVKRINRLKPKSVADFERIGIPLNEPFAGGSFREVRFPKNKALVFVVKFPIEAGGTTNSGRVHSNAEVRKIKKLSKYRVLKQHLPHIYYHDKSTGIIVMKTYKEIKEAGVTLDQTPFFRLQTPFFRLGVLTGSLIKKLTGVEMEDIQQSNIRDDGKEGFVFIDCGY